MLKNHLWILALVAATVVAPQTARSNIILSSPEQIDGDTFQITAELMGESFSDVLALEVDIHFDAPPLSLMNLEIHPESPYSPVSDPWAAPQKLAPLEIPLPTPGKRFKYTFLFVNVSGELDPGPLFLLTLNRNARGDDTLAATVRFQGLSLDPNEGEYDIARSDTVAIPEPAPALLVLAGLGLLALVRLRRI